MKPIIEKNELKSGYIWVPYVIVNRSTSINGEVVWYKNKWKNLLLKIKFFFIKPKYFKNSDIYSKKTINPKYYTTIKLKNEQPR